MMTPSQTAILLLGGGGAILAAGLGIAGLLLGTTGVGFDRLRARGSGRSHLRHGSPADGHIDEGDGGRADTPVADAMRTVRVLAIGLHHPTSEPVMLLQECQPPGRVLPIHLAASDAAMVNSALRCPTSLRSETHRLIVQLIERSRCRLLRVELVGLHEGVFYAQVVLDNGSFISARPSDAVALALHTHAPIRSTELLLRSVGKDADRIFIEEDATPLALDPSADDEGEVADVPIARDPLHPVGLDSAVHGSDYHATGEEIGAN